MLTYLGSNGSALSLSYREFINDMARPAFTEELQVPLSQPFPQKVRAKGVMFQVDKIDGVGLQYSVLSTPTQ